jgi:hypothetical protein
MHVTKPYEFIHQPMLVGLFGDHRRGLVCKFRLPWGGEVYKPSRAVDRFEQSHQNRLVLRKTMNGKSGFSGRFIKRCFCYCFAVVWPPGWLCNVFSTFLQRFASPEMCLQRFFNVFATFYNSISEVP